MCQELLLCANNIHTLFVLCRFYAVVSADHIGEIIRNLNGEMIDIGELFGQLTRPCTEEDFNNRSCVAAAYGVNDEVPMMFDHGNGGMTQVLDGLTRRRRQTQERTYLNIPLRPESTYCLFVMVRVASGVPNVSDCIPST